MINKKIAHCWNVSKIQYKNQRKRQNRFPFLNLTILITSRLDIVFIIDSHLWNYILLFLGKTKGR